MPRKKKITKADVTAMKAQVDYWRNLANTVAKFSAEAARDLSKIEKLRRKKK